MPDCLQHGFAFFCEDTQLMQNTSMIFDFFVQLRLDKVNILLCLLNVTSRINIRHIKSMKGLKIAFEGEHPSSLCSQMLVKNNL